MKHTIKTLILSSFFALNLMGSAPAPEQPALELTPSEIKGLNSAFSKVQYDTVKKVLARGVDLATLDAYLAHDSRFRDIHYQMFETLMSAIGNEDLPLFEYIVVHHPDAINKKNNERNSPLNSLLLIPYENLRTDRLPARMAMIKLLVNNGADKESPYIHSYTRYSGTPLTQAVEIGDYDTVAFLVAQGADINAKGAHEHTALEMAKILRHHNPQIYDKIIALLENYKTPFIENAILQKGLPQKGITKDIGTVIAGYVTGGEVSSKQTKAKRTALNAAKKGLKNNNIEPLEDFIAQYPKDLNAHDEAGDSLLLLAVKAKNVAAVRLILEKVTQLDQAERSVNDCLAKTLGHTNLHGKNAYDLAQEIKNEEIIELLRPYYNAPEMAPVMEE